jgi:hypothetical protein
MTDPWLKARWRADELIPAVTLKPKPHWETAGNFKRFDVILTRGKRRQVLGEVYQEREHMYRKAGRLITRSWHRVSWGRSASQSFQFDGKPLTLGTGIYYRSRKAAVHDLVYMLVLRKVIR